MLADPQQGLHYARDLLGSEQERREVWSARPAACPEGHHAWFVPDPFPCATKAEAAVTATERLRVSEFPIDFRITVIAVSGELDLDTCPLLQTRLAQAMTLQRPPRLVIDLSGLTSADSHGLTVLIAADRHARTSGGRALVCGVGQPMWAIFRQRGLHQVLDTRPTLAEAIRDLRALGEHRPPGSPPE
jgi:anti-anti-sigma factor